MTRKMIGTLVALATTFSAPAAFAADGNFGCEATDLGAWKATGLKGLEGNSKVLSSFQKWVALAADATAPKACKSFPPIGAFIKAATKGGIQSATLIVAQKDVKVYRAYSAGPFACSENSVAGKIGGWWSLLPFGADTTKASYRKANGICNSWNNFTHKLTCTLKKGTVVAIGPTQSAACNHGPNACAKKPKWEMKLSANASHQVFLNTYNRPQAELDKFLTDCTSAEWTDAE